MTLESDQYFKAPESPTLKLDFHVGGVHFPESGEARLQLAQNGTNDADVIARWNATGRGHQGDMDRHPFIHAVRRHWSGRTQATEDARNLSTLRNSEFIERINDDAHVGPHLEWGLFILPFATKAIAKSAVIGALGSRAGTAGKLIGIGSGIVLGAVGGLYMGYESAEALEASVKLKAYDERFSQFKKGSVVTDDSDPAPPLPQVTQGYGWERDIPGVRDVVDNSKDWFKEFPSIWHPREEFTQRRHDFLPKERQHELETFNSVIAQKNLTDDQFRTWAEKESSWTWKGYLAHAATFMGVGVAGGGVLAHEFHSGPRGYGLFMGAAAVGAFGLHWLGYKAKHDSELADLYTARLLSKPDEHPRT